MPAMDRSSIPRFGALLCLLSASCGGSTPDGGRSPGSPSGGKSGTATGTGGSGSVPVATGGTGGGAASGGSGGAPAPSGGSGGAPAPSGGAPGVDAGARPDGAMPGGDGGTSPADDGGAPATRPVDPGELDYLSRPIPVLLFNVGGMTITTDIKVPGTLKVVEDHDGTLTNILQRPAALQVPIGIERRGVTSNTYYKQKPYGFETQDMAGMGTQVSFMGLPREADWVLHSCYSDKSCLRNALIYSIGREIGKASGREWWAPRTRWVEVYLDDQYWGLYLLTEKIKQDKYRISLPAPGAADMSGAYMVSGEGEYSAGTGKDWMDPLFKYFWRFRFPSYQDITAAQKTYVQNSMTTLERLLRDDPMWKDKYRNSIDAPSWIDYHVIQELTHNVDGYFKSVYLYKTPDAQGAKWHRGPLWDYDFALGNVNFDLYYCVGRAEPFRTTLFGRPFEDTALQNEMRCRWNELRKTGGPLDLARIEATIDMFAKHITAAKQRDNAKWMTIGTYVLANNFVGSTYADEVAYLKYWIRKRVAWLDKNMKGTCATTPAPAAVTFLPMPTPARETVARSTVDWASTTPSYVPVDGPPASTSLAKWACPNAN